MKKQWFLPLFTVIGSIIAFVLRMVQNHTGFEAATGLPVSGHPTGLILIAFFVLFFATIFLLTRKLPTEIAPAFPKTFSTTEPKDLTLPIMGVLLLAVSGALDLLPIVAPDAIPSSSVDVPQLQILTALTALLSAVGLFPMVTACRQKGKHLAVNGSFLLIPPVCLVIRLVLTYRIESVNPVLMQYYIQLLALVFFILAFFRLSSFAFQAGQTRPFVLYTVLAVVCSITALADFMPLSSTLFYAGCALTTLGFLLLHLKHI